jgi:polygalacturonase
LDIESGATLLAAPSGYDPAEPNPAAGQYQDFGHTHWQNSLIWGENLHDIAIVGQGRIYGQGLARDWSKDQTGVGNKAIALKLCQRVSLRDFTIQHGGWFGILATGVDNLTIDNLKIDTNRDGMDIDACHDVSITDCLVNSPRDDGICLKSSYGLGYNRATENVTVRDCEVSGFDEGTVLDGTYMRSGKYPTGRIKLGTESNGGFKNIIISNCTFDNCRGLALEEVDGGTLENVTVADLTMKDIWNSPIFIRLGGRLRAPAGTQMGIVRRIKISNVVAYDVDSSSSVIVAGVPDGTIADVTLQDISIWYRGGGTLAQSSITPPEDEKGYPEPGNLGTMPAYGFFLRHVKNISLSDIHTHFLSPEYRPPFVLDDVNEASLSSINAQKDDFSPTFALTNVTNFNSKQVIGLADMQKDYVSSSTL